MIHLFSGTYLSGNVVFFGQILSGDSHRGLGVGVGQSVPQAIHEVKIGAQKGQMRMGRKQAINFSYRLN